MSLSSLVPAMALYPHDRFRDAGLLLIRVGLGSLFIVVHGGPKLLGGPERWEAVGIAMQYFGIDFLPVMWGFMAGAAETVGGLLILTGFLFRPGTVLILCVMIVATVREIMAPQLTPFWPLEMGIVMLALLLIGPGRFSADEYRNRNRVRRF